MQSRCGLVRDSGNLSSSLTLLGTLCTIFNLKLVIRRLLAKLGAGVHKIALTQFSHGYLSSDSLYTRTEYLLVGRKLLNSPCRCLTVQFGQAGEVSSCTILWPELCRRDVSCMSMQQRRSFAQSFCKYHSVVSYSWKKLPHQLILPGRGVQAHRTQTHKHRNYLD